MSKGDRRLGWAWSWLASGGGAVIALVAGAGLPIWSIEVLGVVAALCLTLAAYYLGGFRSSTGVGAAVKRMLILTTILGGVGWLVYTVWPPPIEKTETFAVMVPFDTAPNAFPIPMDVNPDDPLFRTYMDYHSLASNGTVPDSARNWNGIGQISWNGIHVDESTAPSFLGRLLQYYILSLIDELQRNSMTVAVGMPPGAGAGIVPPNATPYSSQKLFKTLESNKFFQPFPNVKSRHRMLWEMKPVMMPLGTDIELIEQPRSTYLVRLKRPLYYMIEYLIECFVGTGVGSVPPHFVTAHPETVMQWPFYVKMRYQIERRGGRDFNPDSYVQWADALYRGVHNKLAPN